MITFRIHHTITETDYGDRHSWQSSALTTAHDDEATIRRMTNEVVTQLAAAGIRSLSARIPKRRRVAVIPAPKIPPVPPPKRQAMYADQNLLLVT